MECVVVIHRAEDGGYWAEVPALPGCYAQGESLDEIFAEVREAIASHLEALRENGQLPREETIVATVAIPA